VERISSLFGTDVRNMEELFSSTLLFTQMRSRAVVLACLAVSIDIESAEPDERILVMNTMSTQNKIIQNRVQWRRRKFLQLAAVRGDGRQQPRR